MRIIIVTDAWHPQINGVVRTLTQTSEQLKAFGHDILFITPQLFKTIPCPSYPEIPLALRPYPKMSKLIEEFKPTVIHIATEGPLGWAARKYCLRHELPFTSAYHTRFPEYVNARFKLPVKWTYALLRKFHRHSHHVMVPTESIRQDLAERGFVNTAVWGRGIDTELFYPDDRSALDAYVKDDPGAPKFINIGRVAIEKNLEAFLALELPGHKFIVGDGPQLAYLKKKYPDVHFLGAYPQRELRPFYNAADVFVFPSKTDTFGLVLLEAMTCGTPVAAYPVPGPIDVVTEPKAGCLGQDLQQACLHALSLKRSDAAAFGQQHSWEAATKVFESLLAPF